MNGLRIGNAERESAAAQLGEHFTAGRLDTKEFEERIELVYQARTADDLVPIFADLPGIPIRRDHGAPLPTRGPAAPPRPRYFLFVALAALITIGFLMAIVRAGPPPFFVIPLIWLMWGRRLAHRRRWGGR